MMRVLGVDPSISATGLCGPKDWVMLTLKGSDELNIHQRLAMIRRRTLDLARYSDLVVIEGFSYTSKFKQHDLGGLGWILRQALWENEIPYVVVPPKKRPKFATGNGNAGKLDVFKACIQRLNLDPGDDNQADAAWLRAMGLAAYGELEIELPKTHMVALKFPDFEWPTVNGFSSVV